MPNDKELLQKALDVLELVTDLTSYDDEVYDAIDAIKARLAQPEPVDTNDIKEERVAKTEEQRHEPDPVAWRQWIWKTNLGLVPEENDISLYTAPPKKEWVGLTDEELTEMRSKVQKYTPMDSVEYGLAIQCAMEEKLKEKNGMD